MKLAVVVQRYGETIDGAGRHARFIAEHLVRHADVEVLTTCATDDATWANELTAGVETVNDVPIRRFRVRHGRDARACGRLAERIFQHQHAVTDELKWLEAEGPACPSLIGHLRKHGSTFDFCLFFGYRSYLAYYGVRAVASRAILAPTVERGDALGLRVFHDLFNGVRGLLYASHEERSMVHAASGNQRIPAAVAGVGLDVPQNPQAGRFRNTHNIRGPFAIALSPVDDARDRGELLAFFGRYLTDSSGRLALVLAGPSWRGQPAHPRIHYVDAVTGADRLDALAAAELLLLPSSAPGLSTAALEAWAIGKPVLANAKNAFVKTQCIRNNGGLYYGRADEFAETLRALERNRWLSASLGRNGRQYFRDASDWPIIERKYRDLFAQLSKTPASSMPRMPGWLTRRRNTLAPAAEALGSAR